MMNKKTINDNWLFSIDEVKIEHIKNYDFITLDLPHTWNHLDGEDGNDDYKRTKATYVKHFTCKKTNQRVFIEFEGANSISTVYLNGIFLGEHKGGYSRFRFELTNHLKEENELIVYVDNRHDEDVYPLTADFTFFGGIYRSVHLIFTNDTCFDILHKGADGVYVSQKKISKEQAIFDIDIYLDSKDQHTSNLKVVTTLKDMDGYIVTSKTNELKSIENRHITQTLSIDSPHLWHGIKDPYLYTIEVCLYQQNQLIDQRIIPTGFRFFHVDHESFYLNGEPYKLYGVCRHQDREHKGNALTDDMHQEDIKLIQEIGANSIRLAHYQQADLIYTLCDQKGFVVWAEIPYISRTSQHDLNGLNALSQMEELIKQNYNHSSICMWGIGNEITLRGDRGSSDDIYKALNDLTKTIDPYRLSTIAQLANIDFNDPHNLITDLIGYNLYYGWYVGKAENIKDWLKNYRLIHPDKPVCISEYGAEGIINIHSEEPKPWDYSEEYHAWYHETIYSILEKTPFVWGSYVWNMFTFASDSRAEGNTKGINNKGLVSFDRKTKKDAFYYYQAKWTDKPMLHLTAKRFTHRFKKEIEVKAYSNQKEVQFYHDEKYLGTVISETGVFKLNITLTQGRNIIKVKASNLLDQATFFYDEDK